MENDSEVEKKILDKIFGTRSKSRQKLINYWFSGCKKGLGKNIKLAKLIQKMKIHISFVDSDTIKVDLGVWSQFKAVFLKGLLL